MSLQCLRCGSNRVVKWGSGSETGCNEGRQKYKCRSCGVETTAVGGQKEAESKGLDQKATRALAKKVRSAKGVQRYVITAAQNATPVNDAFLHSLFTYCKANKAQLLVIPYRYKNPTSMWTENAKGDDWWAPELKPYLVDQRIALNKNLILLGDIKTQPTAISPLQGFETLTGERSAIVGHPKLELVTVPTPQQRMPKILTTTGAVTAKNYIPSKAGKKGEFHHTFGACVVEIVGKTFHMRQINAVRDGSFCDLDREYSGADVRQVPIAGLVMGDSHIEFMDPGAAKATFHGDKSIIGALKPAEVVWHDCHDFYSRNHHHRGEVFINYVKHHSGRGNVERALDETFSFIDHVTRPGTKNLFVPSNHPDALARWVKETDPRSDPENCVFWAETFKVMCQGAKWTDTGAKTVDPFAYWAMKKLKTSAQAVFLKRDESHLIRGVEVGYHGDAGPNGSKGNRLGFTKIGVKTVIGHSHSPGIRGGVYQVGTSSRLGLEYASGPSSWLHTHCVVYANGKRSLINIIDGAWRA